VAAFGFHFILVSVPVPVSALLSTADIGICNTRQQTKRKSKKATFNVHTHKSDFYLPSIDVID